MDGECIVCLADGSECRCRHCGAATHAVCLARWWTLGTGCPHCRRCDFKAAVGGAAEGQPTALYVCLFYLALAKGGGEGRRKGGVERIGLRG